jgi:membrane associated rhomboid family serine protease
MAYQTSYGGGNPFGLRLTPMVKRLLIINGAVFVAAALLSAASTTSIVPLLGFSPAHFLTRPWTLLTYAFTHVDFFHVLFNMLALFFFGPPLEERWGAQGFLRFYLVSAAGAALFSLLQPALYVIGASGAVYGVMLAFALYWPNSPIYIFGIFPIAAKWLVGGLALFSILSIMGGGGGGIAHWAHLGGFITAFAYLKSPWAPSAWGEIPTRARTKQSRSSPSALLPWVGKGKEARREAPASTAAARTAPQSAAASRAERELLDDVDRILDKISAEGIQSLTAEERKRLDEVSRRRRTN